MKIGNYITDQGKGASGKTKEQKKWHNHYFFGRREKRKTVGGKLTTENGA
jgi:hypothetical protein